MSYTMQLSDYYGYLGHLGLWLAFFMLLIRLVLPPKVSAILILPLAVLLLIPVPEISLVGMSRGAIGDLSVPTSVLLYLGIAKRLQWLPPVSATSMRLLSMQVLLIGLLFYSTSLGLTLFDPYSLGYQPRGLLLAVLVLALVNWRQGVYWWVAALGLGMLAFSVGLMESDNLWDYLLDPLLVIYCAGYLFTGAASWLLTKLKRRAASRSGITA